MDSGEQTLQILSNATGTNTELLNIKVSSGVGDIVVQLDVFNDQNETAKTTTEPKSGNINLNSHDEVFQAIMKQVIKTPHEITFLIILQHLLRIDPNVALSNVVWNVVEKLVHRATQLNNCEEAEHLLNSSITRTFYCQNCCTAPKHAKSVTDSNTQLPAQALAASFNCTPNLIELSPTSRLVPCFPQPTPPPPPAPAQPPPLLLLTPQPPAPPPPAPGPLILQPSNQVSTSNNFLLPQQNTPTSSIKLKTFNWTKIPPHKIINKLNIWTILANDRQYKCVELIDFKGIEGLFCLQTTSKNNKSTDEVDSAVAGSKNDKEPKHIHLLDAQRSLKVNIFLSQFKGYTAEEIVQLICSGDRKTMKLEKLKDLIKFFQNEEELMMLKNFNGDRQRLASAENFLISLLEVSNFKLRIESMILKEEFDLNVKYLEPCLNAILKAGNDLMNNKTLQEILSMIIIIGNFLNSGGYAGNAAGIKLSSLIKLTEIKANKTGMHLLHLITMEVQRYNSDLLDLSTELNFLESVSKLNNDQIEKDIKTMEIALDIIKKQIYLPTTEEDIKKQMNEFIIKAEEEIGILNKQLEELKSLRVKMADFFCEDVATFKVDECFEIFYKFCKQFRQAVQENEKRQELEMKAKMRQKEKEEQLARIALNAPKSQVKTPALLTRKHLSSSIGSGEVNRNSKCNEDDLMAFLQTTSRKKCIRTSRSDKRPDSFQLNFERERDQHSSLLEENVYQNILENCENTTNAQCSNDKCKTSIIQKSWKRLMQNYKASQPKKKCLTPEIAPRRESLQIFIRSNSTVDGRPGQQQKQPSVLKIVRTPSQKTSSVFKFPENEVPLDQEVPKSDTTVNSKDALHSKIFKDNEISSEIDPTASSIGTSAETKHPRVTLKTMASIVQLGCRYSSINEEDLKTTIKNLRTPILEQTQFCFSPVRESSFDFSPPEFDNTLLDKQQNGLSSVAVDKINSEIIADNKYDLQVPLDGCVNLIKPEEINKQQNLTEQQTNTFDPNIEIVSPINSINTKLNAPTSTSKLS